VSWARRKSSWPRAAPLGASRARPPSVEQTNALRASEIARRRAEEE
jgi:hypothetical protein